MLCSPRHKAPRHQSCCTMFLYGNTGAGRGGPFPSAAGSSCRDNRFMHRGWIYTSLPGPTHTSARGFWPQEERDSPSISSASWHPRILLLSRLSRRALGLRGIWRSPRASQAVRRVQSRAHPARCSPPSHHKLRSQRYRFWGEALPPPRPLPRGRFRGGTG